MSQNLREQPEYGGGLGKAAGCGGGAELHLEIAGRDGYGPEWKGAGSASALLGWSVSACKKQVGVWV